MSEELLVRSCAPTLAGMKTANLFGCVFNGREDMHSDLRRLNKIFVKKGLRVLPLSYRDNRALIYVYRPSRLTRDLSCNEAEAILKRQGYDCVSANACIIKLMERLKASGQFPHEIGLFLGYPPEDVEGFIENHAQSSKLTGFWKVYGDETGAKKTFDRYRKCTKIYCEQFSKGRTVESLAVAMN